MISCCGYSHLYTFHVTLKQVLAYLQRPTGSVGDKDEAMQSFHRRTLSSVMDQVDKALLLFVSI